MTLLAEAGDKICGIHAIFLLSLLVAGCTSVFGLVRWWLALPSLLLMLCGNCIAVQELQAPGMWRSIRGEMGWAWVLGGFLAWNGPFLLCWSGLRLFNRRVVRDARSTVGLCISCGYDLIGNKSGVCPECGQPIGPRLADPGHPS